VSTKMGSRRPRLKMKAVEGAEGNEMLDEIIQSLRELMRRVMAMADAGRTFQEMVDFMEKFSRTGTRMTAMLKAQHDWIGEQDLVSALQEALNEVLDELAVPDEQAGGPQ
jgi:hypothetical protein